MKELILGGVRSGKSRFAEQRAHASGLPVTYIATATAQDAEMHDRISAHRTRRPSHWALVEEPRFLAAAMTAHAGPDRCLIVECLTLWLTNLLLHDQESLLMEERDALVAGLPALPGRILLVSNETGLGVVPATALARRFCDEAGRLHQDIAQLCERVILTVAGLPHILKGDPL